jgi:hypothetical protein
VLHVDVRLNAYRYALVRSNDVSAGEDTLSSIDNSLIADILALERALVPLKLSSWNQIVKEMEEFLKFGELVRV